MIGANTPPEFLAKCCIRYRVNYACSYPCLVTIYNLHNADGAVLYIFYLTLRTGRCIFSLTHELRRKTVQTSRTQASQTTVSCNYIVGHIGYHSPTQMSRVATLRGGNARQMRLTRVQYDSFSYATHIFLSQHLCY